MADGRELKPKSFRIDDATAERFKEISNSIGGNQQETLAKLIEAFEFQSGKAVLTDKKIDIEQFERHVTAITRMFMGSLEDNQNVTETVRTEFDALLKSKDNTILQLQERLNTSKQAVTDTQVRTKAVEDENKQLTDTITNLQEQLADKDDKNKILSDLCNNLQSQITAMQDAVNQANVLREHIKQLEVERDEAIKDYKDTKQQLQQEQAQHKATIEHLQAQHQLSMDKALLKADKTHQENIQQIKANIQAQIDDYQQKYLSLLERMQNQAIPTVVE